VALVLAGCQGVVVETAGDQTPADGGFFLPYYFARGELGFTASYAMATRTLTLVADSQIKVVPDFDQKYALRYSHAGMSSDQIEMQIENGLLKSVSSTSQDQTVAVAQATNAILSQLVALQKAQDEAAKEDSSGRKAGRVLQGPDAGSRTAKAADQDINAICGGVDLVTSRVANVTYQTGHGGHVVTKSSPNGCKIAIGFEFSPVTRSWTEADRTARSTDDVRQVCGRSVCFRATGEFRITATATLKGPDGGPLGEPVAATIELLAPIASRIGYVAFTRRAFVTNTTTVTFTNGMITGFKSTDPSELVGFLSLPKELIGSVTLMVPLTH
jgi:hypothetical protein